jgi:hypothetical protein
MILETDQEPIKPCGPGTKPTAITIPGTPGNTEPWLGED